MIISKKTGRLTLNFIFLAIIMLVSGVISLFSLYWYSIPLLAVGIIILSIILGFEINTETMEMRNYYQIMGFKTGKWKSIKGVKYLAIVRIKATQNIGIMTIAGTETSIHYKINLILENKKFISLHSGEQKEIMEIAKTISEKLNLKIYDANSKKWID